MTGNADPHAGRDLLRQNHLLLDWSVTDGTLETCFEVPGVAEVDEVGELVDPNPRGLLPLLVKPGQLLNRRLILLHGLVTEHALRSRGKSSPLYFAGTGVTLLAIQPEGRVLEMIEGHGLGCHLDREALVDPLIVRDLGCQETQARPEQ